MHPVAARTLAEIENLKRRGWKSVTADDLAVWLETPKAVVASALQDLVRRRELVRVLPPRGSGEVPAQVFGQERGGVSAMPAGAPRKPRAEPMRVGRCPPRHPTTDRALVGFMAPSRARCRAHPHLAAR
jgi:hypothetical protein